MMLENHMKNGNCSLPVFLEGISGKDSSDQLAGNRASGVLDVLAEILERSLRSS
jgi:hypothetical protein